MRRTPAPGLQGVEDQRAVQFDAVVLAQDATHIAALAVHARRRRVVGEFGELIGKAALIQRLTDGRAFGHVQGVLPQTRGCGEGDVHSHISPRRPRGRAE